MDAVPVLDRGRPADQMHGRHRPLAEGCHRRSDLDVLEMDLSRFFGHATPASTPVSIACYSLVPLVQARAVAL
jgi:hypothetical protein